LSPHYSRMTPLERAVVDLIRLGLSAKPESVRRYALKLLRATPDDPEIGPSEYRAAIARLVVDQSNSRNAARSVPREVAASATHDIVALTRVERIDEPVMPVLAPPVAAAIGAILEERHPENAKALARAGIEPTRTLLLTGAPGVGKTMTARYLAGALGLPLLSVDLAALISSYLGRTGQNLRRALDHARTHPSVLLLDEFDALGKRRDDPSDVGELKRIVNVLLGELERWPSHSLFVAATNHPELLDRAIWRRFDRTLVIEPPTGDARRAIFERLLGEQGYRLPEHDLALTVDATEGMSGSDLTRFVRAHLREAVMSKKGPEGVPLAHSAMDALLQRALRPEGATERVRFAGLAAEHWGWSQRQIADLLHVSHVTVGRMLKQWPSEKVEGETAQPRSLISIAAQPPVHTPIRRSRGPRTPKP
jgi:hypothetical protein